MLESVHEYLEYNVKEVPGESILRTDNYQAIHSQVNNIISNETDQSEEYISTFINNNFGGELTEIFNPDQSFLALMKLDLDSSLTTFANLGELKSELSADLALYYQFVEDEDHSIGQILTYGGQLISKYDNTKYAETLKAIVGITKHSYDYWNNNAYTWYEGVQIRECDKHCRATLNADISGVITGAVGGAIGGGPAGAVLGSLFGASYGSALGGIRSYFGWEI